MKKIALLFSALLVLSLCSIVSGDEIKFYPYDECVTYKVVASGGSTLQPGGSAAHAAPTLKPDCEYLLYARGSGVCALGNITWRITYNFSDGTSYSQDLGGCGDFDGALPFANNVVSVEVKNLETSGSSITYSWSLIEMCKCNTNEASDCAFTLLDQGSATLSYLGSIDIPITDTCQQTKQEQICPTCSNVQTTGPKYNYVCTYNSIGSSLIPRQIQICTSDENDYIEYVFLKDGEPIDSNNSGTSGCSENVYEVPVGANGIRFFNPREENVDVSWWIIKLCCYDCTRKTSTLPTAMIYPKVDIEQFSVTGGSTIIRDGKILTNFNVIPGVQQTFIQVENRGFFTQNDVKVKVMGLPQGVSLTLTPDTQKIKAHNLGTYQATFTVGSNVPSGTYKITMMAYSENGVFDTIQIDLIVP